MAKTSTKQHWQSYWKTPDHQPPVVHEALLKELTAVVDVRGKKILEVGAGMGGDSVYLAGLGGQVTAVDFTNESLEAVRRLARDNNVVIELIKGEARSLPFADESFDVVFHQGLLEHFKNPLEILKEHTRVLKSGGLLVVDVPQMFTVYSIKKWIEIARGAWFAGWERAFSINELERLMRDSGLTIVKSYGWGYWGKLHWLRHLQLGQWYEQLWRRIEVGRVKLYITWCIGVVGMKS